MLVVAHVGGRSCKHNSSGFDEVSVISQIEGKRRVLFDKEDTDSLFLVQPFENSEHFPHDKRGKAERLSPPFREVTIWAS